MSCFDSRCGARPRRGVQILLSLLLGVGVGSGCYTFQPVGQVAPGDEIRARLTADEAIRQSRERDEPVRVLEGTVTSADGEGIDLSVTTARGQTATETFRFSTSYSVPMTGVESLSIRRLSKLKTGVMMALLGSALYVFLDTTVIGAGDGGNVTLPPNPADLLFRFRVGR